MPGADRQGNGRGAQLVGCLTSAANREDFEFWERVKEAGFHAWTHGGLLCSHLHTLDLTVVADAHVRRNEEEVEFMRKLGLQVPTSQTVQFAK